MDRKLWTDQQDEEIIKLVAKYGTKRWPLISQKLCAETKFERTGKQCRQRWHNHLNPQINNSQWSQEDEEILFASHKQFGNKWKSISKMFVGRTDNSIKNHFYSTIRRCLRRINKLQGQKNSTIKMRNIKPYVLSKILADKDLTEMILDLGKNKPNKVNRKFFAENLELVDQMIKKLLEINNEYEEKKKLKRLKTKCKPTNESNFLNKIQNPSIVLNLQNIPIQPPNENSEAKLNNKDNIPLIDKKVNKKKLKRSKKIIKKKIIITQRDSRNNLEDNKKSYDLICRNKRTINYLNLHEGKLTIELERQEVAQETNIESENQKKRNQKHELIDFRPTHVSILEQRKLQQIIEEQQKSLDKENLMSSHNIFHDLQDQKGIGSFQISFPSPGFIKKDFLEELIIVGTNLKFCSTPKASSLQQRQISQMKHDILNNQRKQSQEQYIEQVLEINFDPDFVFREYMQQQQ